MGRLGPAWSLREDSLYQACIGGPQGWDPSSLPQCLCRCCLTQKAVSLPCQSYLSAGAQPPWSLLAHPVVAWVIATARANQGFYQCHSHHRLSNVHGQPGVPRHSGFTFATKLCDHRHMTAFSGPHLLFIPRRSHSCYLTPFGSWRTVILGFGWEP